MKEARFIDPEDEKSSVKRRQAKVDIPTIYASPTSNLIATLGKHLPLPKIPPLRQRWFKSTRSARVVHIHAIEVYEKGLSLSAVVQGQNYSA
jgi:hypothetical protein